MNWPIKRGNKVVSVPLVITVAENSKMEVMKEGLRELLRPIYLLSYKKSHPEVIYLSASKSQVAGYNTLSQTMWLVIKNNQIYLEGISLRPGKGVSRLKESLNVTADRINALFLERGITHYNPENAQEEIDIDNLEQLICCLKLIKEQKEKGNYYVDVYDIDKSVLDMLKKDGFAIEQNDNDITTIKWEKVN